MERKTFLWIGFAIVAAALTAVVLWLRTPRTRPTEVTVRPVPVIGGPERPEAEISGLAWFQDLLVLLPQYPDRFAQGDAPGALMVLERSSVVAALDGRHALPLEARHVPFDASHVEQQLPGFDGFEAIVFAGDRVFVAAETRPDEHATVGWILPGRVEGRLERVVIDPARRVRLPGQNDLANTGYEALVVHEDRLLALYETNGEVNPNPRVLIFDHELNLQGEKPLDRLEYRLTDATGIDPEGHFWVSNYHWPGAPWQPGTCSLTEAYGEGESHARCQTVERLVELRILDDRISTTRRPPILLQLVDDEHARNWEGLVRLPGRGFLVVTDEHPESILGFVEDR